MIDLRLGDCLEVMKTIKDNSVDAIITDPPYGTTACKWDNVIDFDLMWEQLNRIIKPNGAIVLFGSEPFSSALRMSNIKNYKYDWVWKKNRPTNFAHAKNKPMKKHENISVFSDGTTVHKSQSKRRMPYFPQGLVDIPHKRITKKLNEKSDVFFQDRKGHKEFTRKQTNYPNTILEFSTDNLGLHPTAKPISLMEYLIKTYTNENETVLDFTMGSGTTMLACKNLNRNGIGIEMDANYYDVAVARVDG